MDECRFDNWTRMLGALQDRRAAVRELAGAGVASFFLLHNALQAGRLAAPAFLRGQNLNNKLNIAFIGSGGRGSVSLAELTIRYWFADAGTTPLVPCPSWTASRRSSQSPT